MKGLKTKKEILKIRYVIVILLVFSFFVNVFNFSVSCEDYSGFNVPSLGEISYSPW
jgi:hypothetical protein